MSYIRSGSNPEGLYIWGDRDGRIHIHGGLPCSKHADVSVPRHLFHKLGRAWDKAYGPDRVKRGGLVVEEVFVFYDTGRPVPKSSHNRDIFAKNAPRVEHLIRLTYGKSKIFMWKVTWAYVVSDIVRRRF